MFRYIYRLAILPLLYAGSTLCQTNTPTSANGPGAATVPVRKLPDSFHYIPTSYLRTYEPVRPIQDATTLNMGMPVEEVAIGTLYYDSYGRSIQTVVKEGSPGKKDFVIPVHYDEFGRTSVLYLPFAAQSDNVKDGSFKKNPYFQDSMFYKGLFPNETHIYSQQFFDGSPLNEMIQATSPGTSWTGKGVGMTNNHASNTANDSVRLWVIGTSIDSELPVSNMRYQPGSLVMQQVVDENGSNFVKYLDESGKTVLTKKQIAATPSTGHSGWLCTYYVYDEMNNLRFVITPKAVEALNTSIANWNIGGVAGLAGNLCYSYFYDHLGRMVCKRIPGKGRIQFVYDVRSRLVFVQDSILKNETQPKWNSILYDALDRPVINGLLSYSGDRNALQAAVTLQTTAPSGGSDGESSLVEGVVIHKNPMPSGAVFKYLAISYYDDYSWVAASGSPLSSTLSTTMINSANFISSYNVSPDYAQSITSSARIRGVTTGTKRIVLNSSTTLYTVNFYDDNGRRIQAAETNYTGGVDIVTMQYSYSGKLLRSYLEHQKSGNNPQNHSLLTKLTYDHAGRLKSISKKLDNTDEKVISQLSYNELGKVTSKVIGANVESQIFTYNIRGWLTGINEQFVSTAGANSNYFGEVIQYDYGFTANQLNGAQSGVKWKATGDGVARAFGYTYDRANQLLKADFNQQNTGSTAWTNNPVDYSVSGLSYDANGNILSMKQRGLKFGSSGTIDSLSYLYYSNSNQLQKIADGVADASPMGDFKDTATSGDDYTYDANGNIVKDYNRHLHTTSNGNGATYNFLNKPDSILVAGRGRVIYTYDAHGNQLRRLVTDNGGVTKNYVFLNGFVYMNDTLQYVLHEEGKVRYAKKKNSTTGTTYFAFEYDYFVRDHLQNVRTVLTEGKDTAIYAATMETADSAVVNALFSNVYSPVRTVYPKPLAFDADNTNKQVSRLSAVTGVDRKTGPSLVLKVMAGDKVQISTFAFYNTAVQPPPGGVDILNELVTALGGGIVGSSGGKFGVGDVSGLTSSLGPNVLQFLNGRTYDNSKPKAYLNWILFDNQFNYVASNSGVKQIEAGSSKQALVAPLQNISKNGYLYVYVSNESQQDVYFDDLNVKHYTGPLVQEQSYYPFGLQMAAISDKAILKDVTSQKFNAGSEYEDEFGISYYSTFYRKYDPQVGRFSGVDVLAEQAIGSNPYQFGLNNPVSYNDPSGALTQKEFENLISWFFGPENHGIVGLKWSADYGGNGSAGYGGGYVVLFGSLDEAIGYASAKMTQEKLWGSQPGWARSFTEVLRRADIRNVSEGMVKGLFMARNPFNRYNVDVFKLEDGSGFNIHSTSDFMITPENIGYNFYSTDKVTKLLAGEPTAFSEVNSMLTPFGAPLSGVEYQVGKALGNSNRLDQIFGGNESWMLKNNPYLRTRPINIDIPFTGRTLEVGRNVVKGISKGSQGFGIVSSVVSVGNDISRWDRGEITTGHLITNVVVQIGGIFGGPWGAGISILYGMAEDKIWGNH